MKTLKKLTSKIRLFLIFATLVVIIASVFLINRINQASAGPLDNFKPGNIMSDYVMGNHTTMTEAEIQAFLKSKNPCNDTDIAKAQLYPYLNYNIRDGHFVCMADEDFNGETAAHIIWQAAQDYRINPQVLIVLLQKEQGLVTDTWPNHIQYRSATGYGCPDTAPCDSQYYGLKNQIRMAARLFRTVLDGGWTNYPVGENYVLYNPNRNCGGSVINIENRATSALYRYTPYQPNAGALAAGYGTAYCGAYGNRNFYLYFTNWFGGTQGGVSIVSPLTIKNIEQTGGVFTGQRVRFEYKMRNTSAQKQDLGYMIIIGRDEADANYDVGYQRVILNPFEERVISGERIFIEEKTYNFSISNYREGVGWDSNYPMSTNSHARSIDGLFIQKAPTLVNGLEGATDLMHVDKKEIISLSVKNNSERDLSTKSFGLIVKTESDSAIIRKSIDSVIPAGETKSLDYDISIDKAGKYTISIANNELFQSGDSTSIKQSQVKKNVRVAPSVEITEGIKVSDLNGNQVLSLNKDKTYKLTIKLKNYSDKPQYISRIGVGIRNAKDENRDPHHWPEVTIPTNSEYVYEALITPREVSTWRFWYSQTAKDYSWWNGSYPKFENGSVIKDVTLPVKESVQAIDGIKILDEANNPVSVLHKDKTYKITLKLKNYSDKPQYISRIGVGIRNAKDENRDPHHWPEVTIPTNSEYVYEALITPREVSTWRFWYSQTAKDYSWWNGSYPKFENGSVIKDVTLPVKESVQAIDGIKILDEANNPVSVLHKDKTYKITLKLKNYSDKPQYISRIGVGIRNAKDENRDPHHWPEVTIPTNSEYVYEALITPREVSTWRFWYSQTAKDYSWWNGSYPKFENGSVIKDVTLPVKESVQAIDGIKILDEANNPVSVLHKDKTYKITLKLKNYSDKPQYISRIGVGIRNAKDENRDPHHWPEVTIPTNSEYVYEALITPREVSTWRFWYSQVADDYSWWNGDYPKSDDGAVIREVVLPVRSL